MMLTQDSRPETQVPRRDWAFDRPIDRLIPDWIDVAARILISLLFLVSAWTKLAETSTLQAYMHAFGVPGILVWPAAAWELAAGLLFLVGFAIRPLAILLAGWCLLTAVIFHTQFSNLDALMNFFKNCAMAGGFLLIAKAHSAGFSLDRYLRHRRAG
jgi:putative oxidoreductase